RRGPLLLFIAPSPPALYTLSLHDALPLIGELRGLLEEQACLLLTLTQLITLIGEPRSGLLHDAMVNRQVDDGGFPGYTLTVDDVELGDLERWGHLVLDDLGTGAVADRILTVLEGLDAADINTDGGVELQRLTARGGLRGTEHHADLLTELVDEDRGGAGVVQGAGHLAQGLGHQAGLQTDVAVTHLTLDLRLGGQGRHGVDDDDIDGTGSHEHIGDFQCLLTGVRLGYQQRVGVYTEFAGV